MEFYIKSDNKFEKIMKEGIKILIVKNIFYYAYKNDKRDNVNTEYEFRVFKGYSPPFWFYDKKTNKHIIAIPDKEEILNDCNEEMYLKIKGETLHSILHEIAHSLFSVKELEEVSKYLETKGVPFDVLNIVEDIRIENALSKQFLNNMPIYYFVEKYLGTRVFKRQIINSDDTFKTIIFKLLSHQGFYTKKAYSNMLFLRIEPYLKKIKEANKNSIINIAIDFYNDFKEEFDEMLNYLRIPENLKRDAEAKTIAEKLDIKDELNQDEIKIINNSKVIEFEYELNENEKISINFNGDTIKTETDEEASNFNFIKQSSKSKVYLTKKDKEKIKQIKKELMKISLKKKEKFISNDFNIKELNISGVIDFLTKIDLQSPVNIKEKEIKGKLKKIHFFLDLSGSMNGEPIKNAVFFLLAVNEIYTKDKTTSTITLHRDSKYQTIKIPMNTQDLLSLIKQAVGSRESIDIAIKNTEMKHLKESDLIIAITDALISEKDEKALLKLIENPKAFILYTGDKKYFNEKLLNIKKEKIYTSEGFLKELIEDFTKKTKNKKISKRIKL